MYRVYVKENGVYHLVEAFKEKEKVYSKIDEYIREYEEVIVLKEIRYGEMQYIGGKKRDEFREKHKSR